MKNIAWVRALLMSARTVPKIIGRLDQSLEKMAMSGLAPAYCRTEYTMECIIDAIMRKQRIIDLGVLTRDMLSSVNERERRLLTDKYIYGRCSQSLAEKDGVSMRTMFRRLSGAAAAAAKYLEKMGYGDNYFRRKYREEKWFIKLAYLEGGWQPAADKPIDCRHNISAGAEEGHSRTACRAVSTA